MINPENVWYGLCFGAPLRMAGGEWNKLIDWIGYPILVFSVAYLFLGWSIWWLVMATAAHGICRIPVTLIGNSVPGHWQNWVWVWIFGYISGLPALVIGIKTHQIGMTFFLCLVPWLFDGIVATFSNLPFSRKFFPWKKCEFIMGYARIFPELMLIHLHNL